MTDVRAPASAAAVEGAPSRLLDRLRTPLVQLNLAGVVLVCVSLVPQHLRPATVPLLVVGAVAVACWAVWVLIAPGRFRTGTMLAGAVVASLGTGLGAPSLIAPVIAALVVTVSDPARSVRVLAPFVTAVALVLIAAAALRGAALDELLSLLAGVGFGALGGVTRRQRRFSELQQRDLLQASLVAEREAQRVQLLEARSTAARDVHDVLAHSLGGLVLQLDAIEALLEHGRVEEASVRAGAARRLAGEGLSEARRAVAALRDPDAVAPAFLPDDALAQVVAAHRELGGLADVTGDPSLRGVDAGHREALAAALRESLVNARRHSPGSLVRIRFDRAPDAMVLHVENPMPAPGTPASTLGGGHGLVGLRERFASLDDGSALTAAPGGSAFVVEATAVLR